jgi:hypothetical protein
VAGTFDRVYLVLRNMKITLPSGRETILRAGEYVIADLKTGRDLAYGWGEIAIQLALYAHGINETGIWDEAKEDWDRLPLSHSDGPDGPLPNTVRLDVGIVVHLPVQKTEGDPACTLYLVDIDDGWTATELCCQVRQWRKRKKLAAPLKVVDIPQDVVTEDTREMNAHGPGSGYTGRAPQAAPDRGFSPPSAAQMTDGSHPSTAPATRPPTLEERAAKVSTKGEASALFQEMKADAPKLGKVRIDAVIKIMQDRLATLVEQAG